MVSKLICPSSRLSLRTGASLDVFCLVDVSEKQDSKSKLNEVLKENKSRHEVLSRVIPFNRLGTEIDRSS